jgi:NO-binding membrane sensor protein with MHYT domain
MKTALWAIVCGVAVWAIPFVASMALFPIAPPDSELFEALIAVVLSLAVSAAALFYFRRAAPSLAAGVVVGFVWVAISIALDAPFFLFGMPEMRLSTADYFADIGATYLMMPVIAGAVAGALRR